MKTLKILTAIGALLVLAISQSMAGPATDIIFPSNPVPLPDLTGSFMDVTYSYNAGTGTGAFLASGWTTDYNISDGNGGATDVGVSIPDSYILSATINYNAGNPILTGGTLTINGAVGDGDTSVTLLTANLVTGAAGTAFGYGDGNNNLFQFRFNATGGSLESAFGGSVAAGGIILDAWFDASSGDHLFTGLWNSSFDSNGSSVGDIDCFTVPEPTTAGCFLLGLGALACGRHSSKNRCSR
ncbi:MAG: hypothetical protein ABSF60_00100 [Verrucomicrobiota bacterium]